MKFKAPLKSPDIVPALKVPFVTKFVSPATLIVIGAALRDDMVRALIVTEK